MMCTAVIMDDDGAVVVVTMLTLQTTVASVTPTDTAACEPSPTAIMITGTCMHVVVIAAQGGA
jgi:hypothetical protein